MYCDFAGCNCTVCDQIEGSCQDCELRDPDRALIDHVYDLDSLMDEVKEMIEEKRAAEGPPSEDLSIGDSLMNQWRKFL